jgi:hypothetical protein
MSVPTDYRLPGAIPLPPRDPRAVSPESHVNAGNDLSGWANRVDKHLVRQEVLQVTAGATLSSSIALLGLVLAPKVAPLSVRAAILAVSEAGAYLSFLGYGPLALFELPVVSDRWKRESLHPALNRLIKKFGLVFDNSLTGWFAIDNDNAVQPKQSAIFDLACDPAGAKHGASTPDSIPASIPSSVADAPESVRLPDCINQAFQDSYKSSFLGGDFHEQGGTLIQYKNGKMKLVNRVSGAALQVRPDSDVWSDETVIGMFHTHPDLVLAEDRFLIAGESFTGDDIAYSVATQKPHYLQRGDKQFMIMPTKATPPGNIKGDWETEFQAQSARGFQEAMHQTAIKIAEKYHLAYYTGQNGELERVGIERTFREELPKMRDPQPQPVKNHVRHSEFREGPNDRHDAPALRQFDLLRAKRFPREDQERLPGLNLRQYPTFRP